MSYILTFIGAKKDTLVKAMIADFFGISDCRTLSRNYATQISIDRALTKAEVEALREKMSGLDIIQTGAKNRRKKLFIADMDSTIVQGETLDELAYYAGFGDQVAAITVRAMNGDLDFEDALIQRVALLKDLDASIMQKVLEKTELNLGALDAVRVLREKDVHCVLISGGFTFFTEAIAARCGFHEHFGNVLGVQNGKLTGSLATPILGPDAKLQIMREKCEKLSITAADTCTIGDGANDRFMLGEAQDNGGLGLAYRPKPILAAQCTNQIHFADLRTILYAQGYNDEDIKQ